MMCKSFIASSVLAAVLGSAQAGPVIIDGTDSNEHGSVSGGVNQAGWAYMQGALQNLGSAVAPGVAKVVTVIGATAGEGTAYDSIASAFGLSTLVGSGWTINYVGGAAGINTYFSTLSTVTTGILYLSTYGNTGGDLSAAEMAAINSNAAAISAFVGGAGNASLGGALFSQAETGTGAYGWLSTLLPGIVATDVGGGGIGTDITLTAAGALAFPALTNAVLSGADPWHGYFSGNLGGLQVLGTAPDSAGVTRNLIIGGGAATIFVPEPGSMVLVLTAATALCWTGRRRRQPTNCVND